MNLFGPHLNIHIDFSRSGISSGDLNSIIRLCERAVLSAQQEEVENILKRESDIPPEIIEATKKKIKSCRGKTLYLKDVAKGSIELGMEIAEIGRWALGAMLAATIFESVKEAWKNSQSHKRITDWLSHPINPNRHSKKIVLKIEDAYVVPSFRGRRRIAIKVSIAHETDIEVHISIEPAIEPKADDISAEIYREGSNCR